MRRRTLCHRSHVHTGTGSAKLLSESSNLGKCLSVAHEVSSEIALLDEAVQKLAEVLTGSFFRVLLFFLAGGRLGGGAGNSLRSHGGSSPATGFAVKFYQVLLNFCFSAWPTNHCDSGERRGAAGRGQRGTFFGHHCRLRRTSRHALSLKMKL